MIEIDPMKRKLGALQILCMWTVQTDYAKVLGGDAAPLWFRLKFSAMWNQFMI
jgi:hypothetical protein